MDLCSDFRSLMLFIILFLWPIGSMPRIVVSSISQIANTLDTEPGNNERITCQANALTEDNRVGTVRALSELERTVVNGQSIGLKGWEGMERYKLWPLLLSSPLLNKALV